MAYRIERGPDLRVPPVLTENQLATLVLTFVAIILHEQFLASRPLDLNPDRVYVLTSWYRDPARNAAVGGVQGSRHSDRGLATGTAIDVDVVIDGFVLETLLGLKRRFYEGVARQWAMLAAIAQAVIEDDHVHLELEL